MTYGMQHECAFHVCSPLKIACGSTTSSNAERRH
jgi:hypothetical protein